MNLESSHMLGKYFTTELYPGLKSHFLSATALWFVSGNTAETITQQRLEKAASPQGARHEETIFSFCLNP